MTEQRLIAPWLSGYERHWWKSDLFASLSLWAILVPQAMAYALLAGVPAEYGLYTAMAAMVGYSLLGSSRELNQGPESAVAILTASVVAPIALGDGDRYLALVSLLALLVGAWCILGGLSRVGGVLTRFLSRPILLGYILGSAVIIVISQLPAFFGLDIDDGDNYLTEIGAVIRNIPETHLVTFALGVVLVAVIFALRRLLPFVPAYLAAAILGILVVALLDLDTSGVAVVGQIPAGLPVPRIPDVALADLWALAGPALAVAVLAYADSVVTAESIAKMRAYSIDANREFLGLGSASLLSGLFQGFPVNGSQTRSVVLADSGARSQMSGILSVALIALTLLFLTPLFAQLPDVALAAIVIVAGIGLFDLPELRRIWRLDTADGWLAILTALGVLVIGMLGGIVVAVILSLLDVARRSVTPHTAVLAREPGTDRFRDIESIQSPETIDGLLIYRFDASLFFANIDVFTADIRNGIAGAPTPVRLVLVDAEAIASIDSTAAEELDDFAEELADSGIGLAFARTHAAVHSTLVEIGLLDRLGDESFHLEVDHGVEVFLAHPERFGDEDPPA